jgi:hypothetical protein
VQQLKEEVRLWHSRSHRVCLLKCSSLQQSCEVQQLKEKVRCGHCSGCCGSRARTCCILFTFKSKTCVSVVLQVAALLDHNSELQHSLDQQRTASTCCMKLE